MRWHGGGGHLVAVSAPDGGSPALAAARAKLRGWGFRVVDGPGLSVAFDAALPSAETGGGAVVVSRAALAVADTYRPVALPALAAALSGGADLADRAFAAPATLAAGVAGRATQVADPAAQGQIAWGERGGLAAAGSSPALVAALLGAGIDEAALAGLALTGTGALLNTPFAGVRLLDLGESLSVAHGRVTVARPMPAPGDASAAATVPIRDGLRRAMAGAVAAHPDAELELSGGVDSRILLAALPPDLRRGRGALTLGSPGAPDVVVARELARLTGLNHRVLDPGTLVAGLSAPDLLDRLLAAARRDEYSLNPLDRLLFALLAEAEPAPPPRFSGQNGEILRGFYYAGQAVARPGTAAMARRIVTWRMLANDRADPRLFRAGWLADHEATVVDALSARLAAMPGADWGTQLDGFYLHERMHRWCGGAVSSAMAARTILLPFFEPGLTGAALAEPPLAKAGGRLAAALIVALEPAFAAVPFAGGVTPGELAAGGGAGRRLAGTAAKVVRKVRQRLARNAGATVGGATALGAFRGHGLHRLLDLEPAHRLGLFDAARLDAIADGRAQPDRATLALLLNACALGADLAG